MMHFYLKIRVQNTSHRLSLHAHKCMMLSSLASAMCVIMEMLVIDHLVFFHQHCAIRGVTLMGSVHLERRRA
jgi:hypothetical protein